MKCILARTIVMLAGLLILAIGLIQNVPFAMGTGFFVFFFSLCNLIEADIANRSKFNRLLRYYVKENELRTKSEMKNELTDYELGQAREQLKVAEAKPSLIYVAGTKQLTDALNRAHARNMLNVVGSEANE